MSINKNNFRIVIEKRDLFRMVNVYIGFIVRKHYFTNMSLEEKDSQILAIRNVKQDFILEMLALEK